MYTLVKEPSGGVALDAFEALDESFGSEEFSESQAIGALSEVLEDGSGASAFRGLVQSGSIVEV